MPQIYGMEGYGTPIGFDTYSVNVNVGSRDEESGRQSSRAERFRVRSLTRNHALSETNPDAWLYARAAFLFFCALLISWVPSSINRLYSFVHPEELNFGLNYTETVVLPLQGFLNACVYIITSQTAVKNLIRSMTGRPELPRQNNYVHSGDLDSPSHKVWGPAGGVSRGTSKVSAVLDKVGKNERNLKRNNNKKKTQKRESVKLDSETSSSVTSLASVHHA